MPGRVNIGSAGTKTADGDLRTLADQFGLTDLNSAEHGRPAKKMHPSPSTGGSSAGLVNFQGFAANIDPLAARSQTNQSGAQCLPTANRFDVKVRPGMDQKLTGQMGFGSVASNTQVRGLR